MNKKEKTIIIETYKDRVKSLKTFKCHEDLTKTIQVEVDMIRKLMNNLFGYDETIAIENKVKLEVFYENSSMLHDTLLVLDSWLDKINREKNERKYPYRLDVKSLLMMKSHYEWLREEYLGFFKCIDYVIGELQRLENNLTSG